jgi:hypothetical protein
MLPSHDYEMYDEDCKIYPLSKAEFEQILSQLDHNDFIDLDTSEERLLLSKEHFTDAYCNPEECLVNGWDTTEALFDELMKYVKAKIVRKAEKKAAKKAKKLLAETPEGLRQLIDEENERHDKKLKVLAWKNSMLTKNVA